MIKKGKLWLLIILVGVFIVMVVRAGNVAIAKAKTSERKDYRIEVFEPGRIIIVEQIYEPILTELDPKALDERRSATEVFKEAIEEVEREYDVNIYCACPILEPGYPPVLGSWTKALILFVEPQR